MAFNYNMMTPNGSQQQQQNVQPLFPQPQGNVYSINSTLEVANVPVSAGMSVALCLNEGIMYIKSMQNGNPLFWAYKITPYNNEPETETVDITEQFKKYNERFVAVENQINDIQSALSSQKKNKGGGLPL